MIDGLGFLALACFLAFWLCDDSNRCGGNSLIACRSFAGCAVDVIAGVGI